MPKVLLLTASFGEGHNQAARAVAEALERRGVVVKLVDYTEWLHPALRSFAKFSLIQGVKKVPTLYGLFYRSMSRIQPSSSIQKQLNHLGMAHMQQFLKAFRPDVVASTFPTPNGVMSELRATGFTNVPIAAILTDYTAHGQWIHEYTDLYFVATESVKQELMDHGVSPSRIVVSGIPIRSAFNDDAVQTLLQGRKDLRLNQGLRHDLPLILIMGGGAGVLADVSSWESAIRRSKAQFVVICGRNERLYRRLQPLESARVKVLGYTTKVPEWMAMADLIVTKAGGITVTEALAMELPMLVFRPIPGQEEDNASFVLNLGAAHLAQDSKTAHAFIEQCVKDPTVLTDMKSRIQRHKVRGGAERIASVLHQMARGEAVPSPALRV
ncbi:glycosyltransferase [Alicyclobacillus tolerans]|uniref:MGDG synthase family glycosyltransferase n=1 Tax=Alicyclobacillus tolerans TaxID=90970 RepID=UPI001F1DD0E8|nr:glycosyltransferase [Alicyclobacillus tolerans]MCF8563432.1 glycosyltransferase [Alicyclobacillus tolerans]